MKMKKLTSIALAAALAIGTFGASVPAKAADNSTDYTITIPATLTVEQAEWNETAGITAQVKSGDTFDSGKKLTVTAASTNNWALISGDNSVGYNLATATGTYSSSATPASWEFSATELNETGGTNKAMGIIVEDYSDKPAGSYTDTVTFTAKVEDAGPTLAGVALTDGMIIEPHCTVNGQDNWIQFKYVAANNNFVPNFSSYGDVYSKSGGDPMQMIVDGWAFEVLEMHENSNDTLYLTQSGNTVHLRADDGINMEVIDLQLDFDNMTYTQSYKHSYNTVSGSFTSIKIGDTTISASDMTTN